MLLGLPQLAEMKKEVKKMAKPLVEHHCPENCRCKIKDGEDNCGLEHYCYRKAYYCPRCNTLLLVALVSISDPYGLAAAIQGNVACPSCQEAIELDSSLPENEMGLNLNLIQELGLGD
jgi:hypothetical protein